MEQVSNFIYLDCVLRYWSLQDVDNKTGNCQPNYKKNNNEQSVKVTQSKIMKTYMWFSLAESHIEILHQRPIDCCSQAV